jgi:glutamine synthetase
MVPDLDTIRPAPWASSPTAQVIHDATWQNGEPVEIAPRNVLKHVVELYHKEGWNPIVAPELEFYLTKTNPDPDYPLEPPTGRSGRPGAGRQAYSLGAVDEYDKIVDDIYEFAERQYLKIDTIIQEGGAAQLEINLLHGDPINLADQVFLFKRTIREAAFTHGCYATFMAKPLANEPGSAMHIHQSIVDAKSGKNVFTKKNGEPSPLFFHFLAGQQQYLPAAMCLLAPYVNSYRRLVPHGAAPINVEWGHDNRSAGLRVPISPDMARRVENRLAGADSNPYLALAASLACGYLGMKNALEPRPAVVGNAYRNEHQLPRGLLEALTDFEESTDLHGILGKRFCHVYLALKRSEFEEFMRVISPWEREHLLLSV